MNGVYEFNHKGKNILCLDLAGLQVRDKLDITRYVETAKKEIQKRTLKSLLIITNLTNTGFDTEIANIIQAYAKSNSPFVRASALVGIAGWQKVILTAVKIATGRDFYLAKNLEDAKEWLTQQ